MARVRYAVAYSSADTATVLPVHVLVAIFWWMDVTLESKLAHLNAFLNKFATIHADFGRAHEMLLNEIYITVWNYFAIGQALLIWNGEKNMLRCRNTVCFRMCYACRFIQGRLNGQLSKTRLTLLSDVVVFTFRAEPRELDEKLAAGFFSSLDSKLRPATRFVRIKNTTSARHTVILHFYTTSPL